MLAVMKYPHNAYYTFCNIIHVYNLINLLNLHISTFYSKSTNEWTVQIYWFVNLFMYQAFNKLSRCSLSTTTLSTSTFTRPAKKPSVQPDCSVNFKLIGILLTSSEFHLHVLFQYWITLILFQMGDGSMVLWIEKN